LNKETTVQELEKLFAGFGDVLKSKLMLNAMTKRSRGCGYVEMTDATASQLAVEQLNGTVFMGETLVVSESKSTEAFSNIWK
jgi:RNA recognition motif-containing protein